MRPPSPVVHVETLGKMGNQMMQFMTAHSVAARVPGCRISNINLPEWDLFLDSIPEVGHYKLSITYADEQHTAGRVDLDSIVALLTTARTERVVLNGYCQHVGNFGTPGDYSDIFARPIADVAGYGSDQLLINIRMGDIANAHHRDYILLPVDFYVEIVRITGLRPVFLGQIEDNVYCHQLQAAFPDALFVGSRGSRHDFECIRRSKNILLSVSTFSWMAAWLSNADRIFMPVAGMFHPLQHPSSNLIPFGDKRYVYYLFPIHHAVPLADVGYAHMTLRGFWRLVGEDFLAAILGGPRFKRSKSEYLRKFDESYYLRTHVDVRSSVKNHGLPSGLAHFITNGFDESRAGFQIDPLWYFRNYLMASIEVGQGDYLDAAHHYVSVGADRGYSPVPV